MEFIREVLGIVSQYHSYLLSGVGYTMLIALIGTAAGFLIGLLTGVIRTAPVSKNAAVRALHKIVNAVIADRFKKISLFKKAVIGCLFITLVEDIYGIIFNELLHKNVWDYSKMPLNFKGRICAVYSFFWFVLSLIFIPVASKLHNRLEG